MLCLHRVNLGEDQQPTIFISYEYLDSYFIPIIHIPFMWIGG